MPARPLPAGETLRFMQRLWEVAHALEVRSKRMARTIGVTGPQRLVLRIVAQSPGCTARDISDTLGLHPSTLTGILARLERAGALRRKVDPDDRRRARFELTAEGERLAGERRGTVEAAVRRALARVAPGTVEATAAMLATLAAELERDDDAPPPSRRRR